MNVRRTRLVTGLILLTYLSTHLLNHSLGLISLNAMEAGREWFLALWRNPLGTVALYGSLLVHLALAIWSLYQRRHLRMPLWEALQLGLGLMIPLLLTAHVVGTRLTHESFGVEDSYRLLVLTLWRVSPDAGAQQSILVLIAWLHGCIGFHFWLRLRPWYKSAAPLFLSVALLLPVSALLGFAQAGRELDHLIALQPEWLDRFLAAANLPPRSERTLLFNIRDGFLLLFLSAVVLALLARGARGLRQKRSSLRLVYPNEREVRVPRGFSVLEASRFARIPHASVCGGRGRCSTCRVRVLGAPSALPPPSAAEQKVLQRVGTAPNVRLACQLRPTGDLSVVPLLPPDATAGDGFVRPSYLAGQERTVAILFADLRSFTGIAERKLPYDLVFLLNSYFAVLGEAISGAGGTVDKFIGDGVMALFGVETGPERGCRQALVAAHAMFEAVDLLSRKFEVELTEPLKIGVGIHSGPAVVGLMGHGDNVHLTAIGDTVNVASRLQDSTKEYGCRLVISQQVAVHAGIDPSRLTRHELTVRNRREPLTVYAIDDLQLLANEVGGKDRDEIMKDQTA